MFDAYFSMEFLTHANHSFGGGAVLENVLHLLDTLANSGFSAFIQQAFPGIHALPNLHPLAVHFPIALYCSFIILELASWISRSERLFHVASWCLYLGVLFALLAIYLGLNASESVPHGGIIHSIIDQHESYAITATVIAAILSAWRLVAANALMDSAASRSFHFLFAMVMVLMIVLTADLGGLMVFKYGVGVQH